MTRYSSLITADSALRGQFMRQKFPYFSYRYGDKARGITRIGKWIKTDKYFDKEQLRTVTKTERFNITPAKALKIVKSFSRYEQSVVEIHLWLELLPEEEQTKWREAFAGINVIYDKENDHGYL